MMSMCCGKDGGDEVAIILIQGGVHGEGLGLPRQCTLGEIHQVERVCISFHRLPPPEAATPQKTSLHCDCYWCSYRLL